MRKQSVLILIVLAATPTVWGEMGVHWWPAGKATPTSPSGPVVTEFQDGLLLIGGVWYSEFLDPDDSAYTWVSYPYRDVWRSTDGVEWEHAGQYTESPGFHTPFWGTVLGEKVLLLGRMSEQCTVLGTLDGSGWTVHTNSAPTCLQDGTDLVAFQGRALLLASRHSSSSGVVNRIWQSSDGIDWAEIAPQGELGLTQHLVAFNGQLVAIGRHSVDNAFSEDGVTWTRVQPGTSQYNLSSVWSAVVLDTHIWIIGWDDSIADTQLLRSDDAANWRVVAAGSLPARGSGSVLAWNGRIWIYSGLRVVPYEDSPNDIWYTEDTPEEIHRADYDADGTMSLSELLRVIQFFQAGRYQCDGTTEDSYAPGTGWETCYPHSSDYFPQDWRIGLSELLRAVQFYNVGGYRWCPEADTEDGFCAGAQ